MSESITIEYPEPMYSLFNTSRGGLPAIVVVNAKLLDFAHGDFFAWHLAVIIKAKMLGEHGMPTCEEVTALDTVGDEIEAAVIGDRNALFLARITWNGQRQLLYRVNNPQLADNSLQQMISRGPVLREWEFRMEGDHDWLLAKPVISLLGDVGERA